MNNTISTTISSLAGVNSKCVSCFLKTYQRLFDKVKLPDSRRVEFMQFFQQTLKSLQGATAPEIQRKLNIKFAELAGINDLFAEEKALSNSIALKLYEEWKPRVEQHENPFDLALRLSIAGNIMDYGANNDFDIHQTIHHTLTAKFSINHSALLYAAIKNAKSILYLADNAGEIYFDKLFIETINHPNITYAVRGGFALNDATLHDAMEAGINNVAKVIGNGFNAPSTVLTKCSHEFIEVYNSADLIISKGQGNLEGLINENDPRIFFLLMVKCDVMANLLNVDKGSFVVYNPTKTTK